MNLIKDFLKEFTLLGEKQIIIPEIDIVFLSEKEKYNMNYAQLNSYMQLEKKYVKLLNNNLFALISNKNFFLKSLLKDNKNFCVNAQIAGFLNVFKKMNNEFYLFLSLNFKSFFNLFDLN